MGRNLWGEINGEKPFEWRETFRLERNLSIGEKPFDWRETFRLKRNLSIEEKPFDWSQLKFLCYWHYEEC